MHHFDLLSPKRLLQVEKVISLPLNMSSEHFWSVWKIGQFSARPLHENVILGGRRGGAWSSVQGVLKLGCHLRGCHLRGLHCRTNRQTSSVLLIPTHQCSQYLFGILTPVSMYGVTIFWSGIRFGKRHKRHRSTWDGILIESALFVPIEMVM